MVPPSQTVNCECPSLERLSRFSAGTLKDIEFESIASHVEHCLTCGRWIESHLSDDSVALSLGEPDPLSALASERALTPTVADRSLALRGASSNGQFNSALKDASAMPLVLGSYRILEPIGNGGMGQVFKAMDEHLQCMVAIKVLHPYRSKDHKFITRFKHEMKAIGSLDHPNIVRARTAGEQQGFQFLVMDYVEGLNLKQLTKLGGPISVADACAIAAQAAAGLQAIHERGLVHRDIKPSNLMVDQHGVVKILDLGLVQRNMNEADSLTLSRDLMGTVDYMAPEQASDPRDADTRADIYSLGCTTFELLTGHAPFSGADFLTIREKLQAHHAIDPPSARAINPLVPESVDAAIRRAMAKDPKDRFSTPAQFQLALLEASEQSNLAMVVRSRLENSRTEAPPRNRRRFLAWVAGCTTAAAIGVAGWVRDLFRAPELSVAQSTEPQWSRNITSIQIADAKVRAASTWNASMGARTIDPSDWCLFQAGTIDASASTTLTFDFEQPRSTGGCGMFLSHRLIERDGQEHSAFQLFELTSDPHGKWYLNRRMAFVDLPILSIVTLRPSTADPRVHRDHRIQVSPPRRGRRSVLQIILDSKGLQQIVWNDQPIAELADESTNQEFLYPADYLGAWGVVTTYPLWIYDVSATIVR